MFPFLIAMILIAAVLGWFLLAQTFKFIGSKAEEIAEPLVKIEELMLLE